MAPLAPRETSAGAGTPLLVAFVRHLRREHLAAVVVRHEESDALLN